MSRLPIPHFIQEIKTKLGFDRTMTASGDDVVDAVNKQSRQIGDLSQLDVTANNLVGAINGVNSKLLSYSDIIIQLQNYTFTQRGQTYIAEILTSSIFSVETLKFVQVVYWGSVTSIPYVCLDGAGTKVDIISPENLPSGAIKIRGFY